MPHDEPVRRPRVPPIRDQRHVRQPRAHDRRAGLELFRHAGTAFGAFVPHDQHEVVAPGDLAGIQRVVQPHLLVETHRLPREAQALLARDLRDGARGREIPPQNLDVAALLDRAGERSDDHLVLTQAGEALHVLREGLARDGRDIAVQHPRGDEQLLHGRHAPDLVEVRHEVFPAGSKVGDEGDLVADALEVVQRQLHPSRDGHGEEVQHRVRGPAQRHGHDDRVLEAAFRDQVARLDVSF